MSLQTLVRLVKEEDGGVFDLEDIAVMATATPQNRLYTSLSIPGASASAESQPKPQPRISGTDTDATPTHRVAVR